MLIPELYEHPTRYYVAMSEEEAYASFATYTEAVECIKNLKLYNMDYINNVIGIIEAHKFGKTLWVVII